MSTAPESVLITMPPDRETAVLTRCLAACRVVVQRALSEAECIRLAAGEPPDLVLLGFDEDANGSAAARLNALRRVYAGPVAFFGRRRGARREILALEAGADEFLDARMPEALLGARLLALLRRGGHPGTPGAPLTRGALTLDPARREVFLEGRPLGLTTPAFDLLHLLMRHAGRVVSRDEISRVLLGREFDGLDRTVDILVCRLRKLIQDPTRHPRFLKTVHGQGYLFLGDSSR